MPKELTHWMLAGQAAQRLDPGRIKDAVTACPNLYLLGAVVLDTPLYALYCSDTFNKISLRLHGTRGEDTFQALHQLVAACPRNPPQEVLALFCGIMSHIMADCAFHPWVCYFSGPCNDVAPHLTQKSLARHRLLETWLDVHTFSQKPWLSGKLFAQVLYGAETSRSRLLEMLSLLYFNGRPGHETQISLSLVSHGFLQWVFLKEIFFRGFEKVNHLAGNRWDAYATLFYPKTGPDGGPLFARPLDYRHPVTGRPRNHPLARLEDKAVSWTARFFQIMEKHLENNTFLEWFGRLKGPSLETGLVGVPGAASRHINMEADLDAVIGL